MTVAMKTRTQQVDCGTCGIAGHLCLPKVLTEAIGHVSHGQVIPLSYLTYTQDADECVLILRNQEKNE